MFLLVSPSNGIGTLRAFLSDDLLSVFDLFLVLGLFLCCCYTDYGQNLGKDSLFGNKSEKEFG